MTDDPIFRFMRRGAKAQEAMDKIRDTVPQPMKRYLGKRTKGGTEVFVEANGERHALPLRDDIRNHSPTGEWGYFGSGPAQLALAILADHLATNIPKILVDVIDLEESPDLDPRQLSYADRIAERLHQPFKRRVIGRIATDQWILTEQDVANAITYILEMELKK